MISTSALYKNNLEKVSGGIVYQPPRAIEQPLEPQDDATALQ